MVLLLQTPPPTEEAANAPPQFFSCVLDQAPHLICDCSMQQTNTSNTVCFFSCTSHVPRFCLDGKISEAQSLVYKEIALISLRFSKISGALHGFSNSARMTKASIECWCHRCWGHLPRKCSRRCCPCSSLISCPSLWWRVGDERHMARQKRTCRAVQLDRTKQVSLDARGESQLNE